MKLVKTSVFNHSLQTRSPLICHLKLKGMYPVEWQTFRTTPEWFSQTDMQQLPTDCTEAPALWCPSSPAARLAQLLQRPYDVLVKRPIRIHSFRSCGRWREETTMTVCCVRHLRRWWTAATRFKRKYQPVSGALNPTSDPSTWCEWRNSSPAHEPHLCHKGTRRHPRSWQTSQVPANRTCCVQACLVDNKINKVWGTHSAFFSKWFEITSSVYALHFVVWNDVCTGDTGALVFLNALSLRELLTPWSWRISEVLFCSIVWF